jgi:hypothetical protein
VSPFVVEPTVKADGSEAGELSHASALSLPAETTTTNPASIAAATPSFSAAEKDPPRLMLTTDFALDLAA